MIAVDTLMAYPTAAVSRRYGVERWCHLFETEGDTAVLMAFAESIGMNVKWLQSHDPRLIHFDLTPARRARAVRAGAAELDRQQFAAVVLANMERQKAER